MPRISDSPTMHAVCPRGAPAISRYCFGISPPRRRPDPAAGTTAQMLVTALPDKLIINLTFFDQAKVLARIFLHRLRPILQSDDSWRASLRAVSSAFLPDSSSCACSRLASANRSRQTTVDTAVAKEDL